MAILVYRNILGRRGYLANEHGPGVDARFTYDKDSSYEHRVRVTSVYRCAYLLTTHLIQRRSLIPFPRYAP